MEFNIHNDSGFNIHSLSIQPHSQNQTISIEPDKSKKVTIDLNDVKQDGCYLVSYKFNDSDDEVKRCIGYFSNGIPSDEKIEIWIKKDTLIYRSNIVNEY
ncbi:hypothetical protein RM697_11115 [Ichthyenterobacterium sp. W332]|uniref:Uncharacterized protein n=1 Tax=Microcosmobacter mediterraneus TaxID=3075607 RepID=A0ABU2YM16_9FLAO|nr:hypothetical protein [Ichthyenterobacterium sp. W332]MDT0559204.1 hypothetical protein [Ichthyenterobacterium sp. W332]